MPTLDSRTDSAGFPRTRWSLVARVAQPGSRTGSSTRRHAFEELVAAYWRPVYRALRVKHRRQREEAEDLTQAFFLEMIEKRTLERFVADPQAGRFRGLLRSLLERFTSTADRNARRKKRGGDAPHVPLDPAMIEAIEGRIVGATAAQDEDPFDLEWRATIIDQALADLANEARTPVARRRLEVFLAYEVEPARDDERPTYGGLARELGCKPHDVKNDLVAARRRFAELVLERIRDDVRDDGEAREELRTLFGVQPP
ncbi:MAG: sigma-70 family RNA polymerase sigma factor [Planctomycetota bacterium]|nr:sigma-70 family RNA polymerase sigma factor [Planctomycetota bacterium]